MRYLNMWFQKIIAVAYAKCSKKNFCDNPVASLQLPLDKESAWPYVNYFLENLWKLEHYEGHLLRQIPPVEKTPKLAILGEFDNTHALVINNTLTVVKGDFDLCYSKVGVLYKQNPWLILEQVKSSRYIRLFNSQNDKPVNTLEDYANLPHDIQYALATIAKALAVNYLQKN